MNFGVVAELRQFVLAQRETAVAPDAMTADLAQSCNGARGEVPKVVPFPSWPLPL